MATTQSTSSSPEASSTEKAPYQVETTSKGTTVFYLAAMILSFAATFIFLVYLITSTR